MDKNQSDKLLAKGLAGELNEEEQQILENWIVQSSANKKEFDAYKNLWKKSKNLTLSNEIDVESSLVLTKKRIADFNSKKRWITYFRQAAAVLIISFCAIQLYSYFFIGRHKSDAVEQIVVQEVKAAYGTQTKLQLADGTNVWLNSGSTLRFPISFNSLDERNVELDGEAYFEVAKNEEKPFIVNTSELDVKVHGTSFNVNAYDDNNSVTVALVEGKVSLEKEYSNGSREMMVLKPNDIVRYDIGKKTLSHSTDLNMNRYTAWKDGYIVFFGDPIENVVQRLEKWYNVEIEIKDNALRKYMFTATFANESLEQVLFLLSLSSDIQYQIFPSRKQKDNSFSMRKVTISMNN